MARELILKLGKKITDRVDVKLGMTQLDETSPEYYGLASVVTDEMAELALAMKAIFCLKSKTRCFFLWEFRFLTER